MGRRLMGFPDDFWISDDSLEAQMFNSNKKCYRRLGNAVCPPVIAAIAGAVLAHCGDLHQCSPALDWVAVGRSTAVRLAISALPLTKRSVVASRLHESWHQGLTSC